MGPIRISKQQVERLHHATLRDALNWLVLSGTIERFTGPRTGDELAETLGISREHCYVLKKNLEKK